MIKSTIGHINSCDIPSMSFRTFLKSLPLGPGRLLLDEFIISMILHLTTSKERPFVNPEMINKIVKLAVNTATQQTYQIIKQNQEQEKKTAHDRRLKNTKLLLKNYRFLKQHSNSIRLEINELNEILIMDSPNIDQIEIESIKKSKRRTLIMIKYVEKMLEIYESINEKRHKIISATYINDEKNEVKDLSKLYEVTPRSIYKEINLGVSELASLLWGVDSILL